jgi:hypothetical protein
MMNPDLLAPHLCSSNCTLLTRRKAFWTTVYTGRCPRELQPTGSA